MKKTENRQTRNLTKR